MRFNPLWHDRDYMSFWSGGAISTLGSSMSSIAFPLLILSLTHSPALAGLAGTVRAAPFILLALPAGALADRWNRKHVMLFADIGRAVALGSIPAAWWAGHLSLIQLYVVTTTEGTLYVFYSVASLAALPRLVPKGQLAAASAQYEGSYYVAGLIGPTASGILYQVGRALPFLADAVSYLASVLSLLLIKSDLQATETAAGKNLRADIREGLAWMWHSPLIRALSFMDVPDTLVTSGLSLLVIVLAQQHHATPRAIGVIFSIAAGGGILGAIAGAQVQRRLRFGQTIIGMRWAVAVLWPLYAVAPNAITLGIITAGIYFLNPLKNVALVSYALPLIPEGLRARVVGMWDLLPSATASVGVALMGLGLQTIGPTPTVAVCAMITLLLALAVTRNAHIRNAPAMAPQLGEGG